MRCGSSIVAGLVLAVALGRGVLGCGTPSFVCQGDESCAGLLDGRCEPDGHCSIPTTDCDSGRRYAAHSGALSGQCVGAEATGTSAATLTGNASEGEPTSLDDDGTGTTASPPGTTGTDPTGGPELEACEGETIMDEPFVALPLDPSRWSVFNDAGIAVNVLDGALRLSAVEAKAGGYAYLGSTFALPESGSVGVELLAIPPPGVPAEAYVVLTSAELTYGFQALGGYLELIYEHRAEPVLATSLPYDPVAHRWLRLVLDATGDSIAWEAASTVGEWERLAEAELEVGFDFEESWFVLGAGVWDGPITASPLAAFGHAFACGDDGLKP